jgi:hypothetical protein
MPIKDEKYNEFAAEVEGIVKFNQEKRANRGVKIISDFIVEQGYAKSNPELFAAYNKLIAKLRWVALLFCNEDQIAELFKKNLSEMLEIEDYDLWNKFAAVLVGKIIVYEKRDEYKERIKSILNKNQELITADHLANGLAPTTENWIKDYTTIVGLGQVESIKMQNYFLNSESFKKLKPNEKEGMKKFFQFYERLKLSSLTVAGLEETMELPIDENGAIGYIRDGKIEKDTPLPPDIQRILDAVIGFDFAEPESAVAQGNIIDLQNNNAVPKISPADENKILELKQAAEQYAPGTLQRKAVEGEIRKLEGGSKK